MLITSLFDLIFTTTRGVGTGKAITRNKRREDIVKRPRPNLMRMKQLSAESGVPKGTIQFYIREGLIPRPYKTHANMAYYNESHLNAIRLIKELQKKRFLPLSVIKQVVQGAKEGLSVDEIRALTEIDGKIFRNLSENPEVRPVTAKQLSEQTGVSLGDIRKMERSGS